MALRSQTNAVIDDLSPHMGRGFINLPIIVGMTVLFLALLMRLINGVNRLIENVFAWCSAGIVAVCFWVVVERYGFTTTRLWMQDLYVWLNGAMFTAVAGY